MASKLTANKKTKEVYAFRFKEWDEDIACYECHNVPKKTSSPDFLKKIFQECLETYVSEREGYISFPRKSDKWALVKGASVEEIEAGGGEVLETFHAEDAEGLWKLHQWVSNGTLVFRICTDY